MKNFEFQKSYEEVKIAGKVYKMDMSDDKVMEYQETFKKYYDKADELSNVKIEDMSVTAQVEMLAEQKGILKEATELMLGEGSFDELYEASGKSTINFMELFVFLGSLMNEKTGEIKANAANKYIGE